MSFDSEKEIGKALRQLKSAQDEIGKTYMRWREAAIALAGADADPMKVSLKAAEIMGSEMGKSWLPRLNWLKGEEGWLMGLAQNYASHWTNMGAVVKVEKSDKPSELLIKWKRCPWPTYAKEYGVQMEEDVQCCDKILQSVLKDVNVFFNVNYNIETLKAIPRGQGECVRRLFKVE